MIRVLFLIHDLGQGGAEKVLVNLVNNMDRTKFDISVIAMFGGGVNEQFLKPDIHYKSIWPKAIPGNSKLLKIFTPKQLHSICVKDKYDIEVAYLEGVSARVISGANVVNTHIINWIHVEQHKRSLASASFRSEKEAKVCYGKFEKTICVAQTVKQDFISLFPEVSPCEVLYNTVESEKILAMAEEVVEDFSDDNNIRLIAVGSLKKMKAFDRLLRITKRLIDENYKIHLYILGKGPLENQFKDFINDNGLQKRVTLLGYQTNPYKYIAKSDLFVCSSHREGFSTAATEALILGIPVCTVEVSGMREMLGENNEYGVITNNSEDDLYDGLKKLLDNPDLLHHYGIMAKKRGKYFSTDNTVKAVEKMFEEIMGHK